MSSDRVTENKVNPIFVERYSSRTFAENAEPISTEEMNQLFEASRWAASYANSQPWRYVYVRKSNTEAWNKAFTHLMALNQKWVEHADVLLIVLSYKKASYYGQVFDSPTHSFDAGAATAQLLLQASEMKLVAHPIGGFDYAKIHEEFVGSRSDKDDYTVNAIVVLGRAQEQIPEHELPRSQRNPISQFAFENALSAESTD